MNPADDAGKTQRKTKRKRDKTGTAQQYANVTKGEWSGKLQMVPLITQPQYQPQAQVYLHSHTKDSCALVDAPAHALYKALPSKLYMYISVWIDVYIFPLLGGWYLLVTLRKSSMYSETEVSTLPLPFAYFSSSGFYLFLRLCNSWSGNCATTAAFGFYERPGPVSSIS